MNITDLTEAARCKTTAHYPPSDYGPILWTEIPCYRCKDHPGIDPDVMRHMFALSHMSKTFTWTEDSDDPAFVVIPVTPV